MLGIFSRLYPTNVHKANMLSVLPPTCLHSASLYIRDEEHLVVYPSLNPMDGGTWQATVPGLAESWM